MDFGKPLRDYKGNDFTVSDLEELADRKVDPLIKPPKPYRPPKIPASTDAKPQSKTVNTGSGSNSKKVDKPKPPVKQAQKATSTPAKTKVPAVPPKAPKPKVVTNQNVPKVYWRRQRQVLFVHMITDGPALTTLISGSGEWSESSNLPRRPAPLAVNTNSLKDIQEGIQHLSLANIGRLNDEFGFDLFYGFAAPDHVFPRTWKIYTAGYYAGEQPSQAMSTVIDIGFQIKSTSTKDYIHEVLRHTCRIARQHWNVPVPSSYPIDGGFIKKGLVGLLEPPAKNSVQAVESSTAKKDNPDNNNVKFASPPGKKAEPSKPVSSSKSPVRPASANANRPLSDRQVPPRPKSAPPKGVGPNERRVAYDKNRRQQQKPKPGTGQPQNTKLKPKKLAKVGDENGFQIAQSRRPSESGNKTIAAGVQKAIVAGDIPYLRNALKSGFISKSQLKKQVKDYYANKGLANFEAVEYLKEIFNESPQPGKE
jgi:hypothetical protein